MSYVSGLLLGSSGGGSACIGAGTLASFAEGGTEGSARDRIERHLADCVDCRAVLARAAGVVGTHRDLACSASDVDADAKELAPGTRVGRYVVERPVGRGAMGAVYAASDPDLDRVVAVKLLRVRSDALSDAARQQMRGRLLREAQAMARLSHPGVIAVYDVGAFGEELFVAMEYVEGETLRHWCKDPHRHYSDVLAAYERAGSGLAAAHEVGLVHRDFKPDNVLVGNDGRVRVTDFGLARSVDRSEGARTSHARDVQISDSGSDSFVLTTTLTRTGTLLGTPAYMAPEQLRGGAADARSDVFSFCVALFEALYGERPFEGATVALLRTAVDEGAVRAPPVLTRVPRWIRAVLLRGLRAEPDDRYPSMRALLDALNEARDASKRRGWTAVAASGCLGIALVSALLVVRTPAVSHGAAASVPFPLASRRVAVGTRSTVDLAVAVSSPIRDTPRALPIARAIEPPPAAKAPRPMTVHPGPNSPQPIAAPPAAAGHHAPLVGNNGALILE